MPSPLVHTLLPTAVAATSSLTKKLPRAERLPFFILCVFLGNCPDFDLTPTLFDRHLWTEVHRWFGHNLFAFIPWVAGGIWGFRNYVPSLSAAERRWAAFLLVLSHLVLDGMVAPGHDPRTGVPLFWPLSTERWHFPIQLFPRMSHQAGMHKLIGFAVAKENWVHVFGAEFLMCVALWALLTLSGRLAAHLFAYFRAKTKTGANPILQSSPQYTPAPPSPLLRDDSPIRTYKDSGLGS